MLEDLVRYSPSLATIDRLNLDAVVAIIPKNFSLPLQGSLSLFDWRLCFFLSRKLRSHKPNDQALMLVDLDRLPGARIILFFADEALSSAPKFDALILRIFKHMNQANLERFALLFPEQYPWIWDHWKRCYESNSMFNDIGIFEPCPSHTSLTNTI